MIAVELRDRRAAGGLVSNRGGARQRSLLLCSAAGLAIAMLPTAAQAACSPDPTVANGTTICIGIDSDGVTVPTASTTVRVAAGATVGGSGATARPINSSGADTRVLVEGSVDGRSMAPAGAAIQFSAARPRVDIAATGVVTGGTTAMRYAPVSTTGNILTADNAGRIEATGSAILLESNPTAILSLTNRAGATLRGNVAVGVSPGNDLVTAVGAISLLDNAGSVSGTSGIAIDLSRSNQRGSIGTLINRSGGRIDGAIIASGVSTLANAGILDGGTRSVLEPTSSSFGTWTNSGLITSRRTDGPSIVAAGFLNSGTISNSGGGAALRVNNLTNLVGGIVSSTGATVLTLGQGGSLDNSGRIVGSVDSNNIGSNRVIQRGTIEGSLRFGIGSDTFLVDVGKVTSGTGVTGTIDAGTGDDAFGYTTTGINSVTVGTLPATFERFVLEASGTDAVLTASGAARSTPLFTQGTGTVISTIDITTTGEIALQAGAGTTINRGTIDFTGTSAVVTSRRSAFGGGSVTNEGIVIARGAQSLVTDGTAAFTNNGSIRLLDGAALASSGPLTNAGVIELQSASSLLFDRTSLGFRPGNLDNRGTISGVGALYISDSVNSTVTITNSGTLSAGARAIDFSARTSGFGNASVDNKAGGLIEGRTFAILGGAGPDSVTNAGRIVGAVSLGAGNDSYLSAGRLEGDLSLGDGNDFYVIDVAAPGIVTGTIDAGAGIDTRRLLARSDAVVDFSADSRFEVTDLLVTGATSTLGVRPAVSNRTALTAAAGTAAVTVNGNAAFTNTAALAATGAAASAIRISAAGSGQPSATNDGVITVAGGATGLRVDSGLAVNRGVVDGTGTGALLTGGRLDNAGRIGTTGAAVQTTSTARVNNSGTLESTTGPAVIAGSSLTFNNLAAGVVRGGAGIAYQGSGSIDIFSNAGRLIGDVELGNGDDTYQYAGGTIEGRLLLGAGNDRVDVGLRGLDVVFATGGVDAGEGVDTYAFSVDSSRSLDLTPVTGFERVSISALGTGTQVTLNAAPSGSGPSGVQLLAAGEGIFINDRALAQNNASAVQTSGSARLINRANIDVSATAQNSPSAGINAAATVVGTGPGVINEGVIRASGAGAVGLRATSGGATSAITLRNNGTVAATGGATGIFVASGTSQNAGIVTADATSTGMTVSGSSRLINSGTVNSAGAGVTLDESFGSTGIFTNTGTVTGITGAVRVSGAGRVVNSGTLSSGVTGGVLMTTNSFGNVTIINEAGGTIGGGGNVIAANAERSVRVSNSGTIEGNVSFVSGSAPQTGSGDTFVANAGGRVTGNILFANSDDMFVADLSTAANPTASVGGTVTMGGGIDTLRLRATRSAAATVMTTATGFERVAYEAAGRGTTLSLTSPTALASLYLSGDGTIDLTADFAATGTALVFGESTASTLAEPNISGTTAPALRTISRGTITSTADNTSNTVVTLLNSDRFENAGTIRLTQASDAFFSRSAIAGNGVVVNSGRIEIADGNTGVSGSGITLLTNSGTIEQVSGTSFATGIANVQSLENSGTIRTAGTAANLNQGRVINSGTIEATGAGANAIFGGALVVNNAGARIAAIPGGAAINLTFGGRDTLINAGTIIGNVELGTGNDLFIAAGGGIEGSVSLGLGDDTYLMRGTAPAPAQGVVNGGGRDAFGRSFIASATYAVDKPAEYDMHAVEAAGASTTVTLTGTAAGGLRVFGTGTVDSGAAIALTGDYTAELQAAAAIELHRTSETLDSSTLRFTNRGNVTSSGVGVRSFGDGRVLSGFARFENSGVIDARYAAVDLTAETRADGVSVANSGTLKSADGTNALGLNVTLRLEDQGVATLPSVELTNSGTITNLSKTPLTTAAQISAVGAAARAANSGTIEAAGDRGAALQLFTSQVTLANTGRLIAIGRGASALDIDLSQVDGLGNPVSITASSLITNDGLIQSNANASYAGFTVTLGELIAASTAVTLTSSGPVELRNGTNGTIEATGDRAGAILFGSTGTTASAFTLTNAGTIRGTGLTLADREGFSGGIGLGGTVRVLAGALHSVDAVDTVTNAATGRIFGGINLGSGNDSLENFGRIEGNILLGAGNDRMVQALAGALVGTADGGDGTDALIFDITGGGTIDFRQFTNFETISQRGRGAVTFAGLDGGPLPIQTFDLADTSFTLAAGQTFATRGDTALTGSAGTESVVNAGTIGGSVNLGAGNDTLVNSGTISGSVIMGDGDDSVTNSGAVGGSVLLGSGADRYTTNGTATVGGTVDGGDGIDTLEFTVAGTSAAPTVWNGTGTTGFETLQLSQGTLSLTGTTPTFTTANITGGYFVGQAGSLLTAQTVNVAQGATFGTSGRVVGNIAVAGTLSPGSSPGTMTVTGNVALAAGSTTLFELTPTVSDQLLVSGTTTIAPNATLTLTGTRATSATPLDLIVSDGGITGSFTTVNKAASIVGFLAQRGNRLQLFSQFATDPAFGPPAQAAIDYVNAALVAGQVSPALAAALPSLLTAQGTAAADRFGELTPEAYATASNYGASRSLLLADTVRTAARGIGDGEGAFVFASGVSEWSDADGGPASPAEFETRGVIGGIGYRFESGSSVSAFVGTLDGEARTDVLRARTDVDGVSFGVHGRFAAGSIDFDATLAYDAGKAKLSRTLAADGSTLTSRFDVDGLVADVSASGQVAIGAGWTLVPRVGFTHLGITRDAAGETGSAFALTTEKSDNNRLFGNLAIELKGRFGTIAPFAGLALRHRLDGREPVAAGQFAGISGTPLRAAGADLGDDVFSIGGGAALDLTTRVRLIGSYEAEVGDRKSHAVSVGLNAAF